MIRNHYLLIFFGIIICISFFLKNLNKEESNAIDIINNEYIQEDVTNHFITDVAIKNIIVYPNWENKNSLYVDIDIENINGDEKVQISLSNGNNLIGSDQILLQPKEKKYSQSFLLEENVDFDSKFYVKISSLKFEDNIENNRYSFNVNLEEEDLKVALITGNLNFNSMAIIKHLPEKFDHFLIDTNTGIHDFKNFWFTNYDLLIMDNFPNYPISDKWLELFARKIYSQNTGLILFIGENQNFDSLVKISPLFGLNIKSENDMKKILNKKLFEKEQFKSVLINNRNFYKDFFNSKSDYIVESFEWLLDNKELNYNFFLGREYYQINDKIFIYGFSDRIDSDKKLFNAKVFINDKYIYDKKLYLNPISNYYFTQISINDTGDYSIQIVDENDFIVETIAINIPEELSKL
ncbi:MAG: hypothetical protein Ct9H90mP15_01720 [Candidatus Neomarinimicrobiota bacterium]|nr:MAG: hypothetical protein Ct9H90mP15_01720 [Candidatus Neomarinimicrobiota bacterium]|tara:strand:- start:4179 stop:5402 length:1224 start_codon:yes stop_codon:yes gene_type:complete